MITINKTIQELAQEMLDQFEVASRDNGEMFDRLKDNAPAWMKEVVHEAHGDMLPDDYRYSFIREAVELITDSDLDYDDEDGLHDLRLELEPATYTGDRLRWLSSNLNRLDYVNSATEVYGHSDQGIADDIGLGQLMEKEEVFELVLNSLTELLVENQDDACEESR